VTLNAVRGGKNSAQVNRPLGSATSFMVGLSLHYTGFQGRSWTPCAACPAPRLCLPGGHL